MKRAQLLGVAIAGVCGLGAFFGVMSLIGNKPTKVVREEVTTNTTQVLVARTEIGLGQITGPRASAGRTGRRTRSTRVHPKERHGPTPSTELNGARRPRADAAGRAGHAR